MTTEEWDGTERREMHRSGTTNHPPLDVLARHLEPARTVEAPFVAILAGFACLALINLAGIWGLVIIADNQAEEADKQKQFREQLSCFVIGISQGKAGADLLTTCNFLTIGVK